MAGPTLRDLLKLPTMPAPLSTSALIMIDCQNTYRHGVMQLEGVEPALLVCAELLQRARSAGTPIIHIAHKGRPGGLFDRTALRGAIVPALLPLPGEPVIEKGLPNAFAGTDLQAQLTAIGRKDIVLAGLMTHMCISSTARAELDLGYRITVDADSCATRDLPDGRGGAIAAASIHDVALAELSDRFAIIARGDALA